MVPLNFLNKAKSLSAAHFIRDLPTKFFSDASFFVFSVMFEKVIAKFSEKFYKSNAFSSGKKHMNQTHTRAILLLTAIIPKLY